MKTISLLIIGILSFLQISGQCLNSETEFRDFYKKNLSSLDPIEGIWSITQTVKAYDQNNRLVDGLTESQSSLVAVVKKDTYYSVCKLENIITETSIKLYKTAISGIYLYNSPSKEKTWTAKANAVLTLNSLLELSYDVPIDLLKKQLPSNKNFPWGKIINEEKWIKIFPSENEYNSEIPVTPASGTGFALSSNGLIVTNYHVIEGAKSIKIRGINSDFSKTLNALLLKEDRNNDLAIIQINDPNFLTLGQIPYTFQNKASDVGSSVFCLGYPLRATMGDEVKITNGIISSSSGYQGDVTSYQVTAPVQAGNSGGPLFDNNGLLIGIINAKHIGAENVTYAIKTSYLLNLIDVLPSIPDFSTTNNLESKTLSEKVKIIKPFVYIIEVDYN